MRVAREENRSKSERGGGKRVEDREIGGAPKKKRIRRVHLLHSEPDTQKSWPTSQPLYTQAASRGTLRPSLCPTSPCRFGKPTPSTTAGTWRVSSSSCFSSSLSCPWQPWPCYTNCSTAAAVPKGRRTTSYRKKGQEAAASSS